MDCQQGNHYFSFHSQISTVRNSHSGAPNDKTERRSGPFLSFQTNPGFACSKALYVSEETEETVRCLLAFNFGTKTLHLMRWFRQPLGT
ncbi:hypothetical protein TNCV_302811 [Trichonephila clavipes]|nr:hypothetical protein TNCV_302811 [Trichonephila clavipes]